MLNLLERQDSIEKLYQLIGELDKDAGSTVLVSGEAGIGKTSLLKKFVGDIDSGIEVLWGACDALFTPRPLSPLYEIAYQIKPDLADPLGKEQKRESIFDAVMRYLMKAADKNILIFEDIHWADEATLDLIKFISRRIDRTKTLFILTYRDDELSSDHPLKLTLGEVPNFSSCRIRLYPLSEDAVNRLMQSAGVRDETLYKRTGGNPFLVTEMLANSSGKIPMSIKDAVISRMAKLSDNSKELIKLTSIIPSRAELNFLEKLFEDFESRIKESINSGLLNVENNYLIFRHELSRLAIADSIAPYQKTIYHKKVLQLLLSIKEKKENLARIIHHAGEAKDSNAILEYAPLAAEQATQLGSHREAALHYSKLLEYSSELNDDQLADILEKYSYECYLTDQLTTAIKARERSLQIWLEHNNKVRIGSNYRWLSRFSWFMGRKNEADKYAKKAIEELEKAGDSRELAMAYSNYSQLNMLEWNKNKSIFWADKAISIAKRLKDFEIESHALNNAGAAELEDSFSEAGESKLIKSLDISLKRGYGEHAARAYTNLGCLATNHKIYIKGEEYLKKGIQYCINQDLDSWAVYMKAWLARLYFETGKWNESADLAESVLKTNRLSLVSKIPAMTTLGWIRLRRNDPGAISLLEEIRADSIQTGEIQRIGPVTAAILESFWLKNNYDKIRETVGNIYELALKKNDPWMKGQLAFWMSKCGKLEKVPAKAAGPFIKQINGDWKSAAEMWKKLNCPYEYALALADGNENSKKEALMILHSLGAVATENHIIKGMRKEGIKNIPRGPRSSTKKNPSGMTERQLEVLKFLTEGLSNSEIGEKLYISPKTVDHHISAILSKLNLNSRGEAAKYAHKKNLFKNVTE